MRGFLGLSTPSAPVLIGRFPFAERFRKFRFGFKWNMIFRFVPLETLPEKWNFLKGRPIFQLDIFKWNCAFHLRVSQRLLPVPGALDHIFCKEIWRPHRAYHFGAMQHTNAKTCRGYMEGAKFMGMVTW